MREENLGELLAKARARIGGARARLADPRTCAPGECVTLLREAQGYLEWLRDRLRGGARGSRELRDEAGRMGREIREAGVLLEQAARRGHRWLELARARHCGYTRAGLPGPLPPAGRLSIWG